MLEAINAITRTDVSDSGVTVDAWAAEVFHLASRARRQLGLVFWSWRRDSVGHLSLPLQTARP